MKHTQRWVIYLLSWVILIACTPTPSNPDPAAALPPGELMQVRPNGAVGQLIAYDMTYGSERFTLPAGQRAADNETFVAITLSDSSTLVTVFSTTTGESINQFTLMGHWALGGISPNGQWLALTRALSEAEKLAQLATQLWQTEIQIVAAADGQIIHTLSLNGHFEVDALTNSGTELFLIQYVPPNQPEQYVVRLYDLAIGELSPNAIRDKRVNDELMTGYAWGSVADPQGTWWLTLYVNTSKNSAFIHALNLREKWAYCIDLPSGEGNLETLQNYSLTLSPDSRTLYAVNPTLGVVAEVLLSEGTVTQIVPFTPEPVPYSHEQMWNHSFLTSNGDFVAFSNGWQVWQYDTRDKAVASLQSVEGEPIVGLAVSADGERLYLAQRNQPLSALALANGEQLSFPIQTAHSLPE